MITNIIWIVIGVSTQLFVQLVLGKILRINTIQSFLTTVVILFVIWFFGGEKISILSGEKNEEIILTEMVKPVPLYTDMEISGFQLNKFYKRITTEKKDFGPSEKEINYVLEYSCFIENKGDPIITIDDPNGKSPISFDEELIFREIDGVDGKEEYINFGDTESSELFQIPIENDKKVEFSTLNPIGTNTKFQCNGKIILPKDFMENFPSNRTYKSKLYISFKGTTKDKYKEPNGWGFVIKEKHYDIFIDNFINKNRNTIEIVNVTKEDDFKKRWEEYKRQN